MTKKDYEALYGIMQMGIVGALLSNKLFIRICKALGIDLRPNPLIEYNFFYCYHVKGELYIYGYQHPTRKDIQLMVYWDWRAAMKKDLKDDALSVKSKTVKYLLKQGQIIGKAIKFSMESLNIDEKGFEKQKVGFIIAPFVEAFNALDYHSQQEFLNKVIK